MPNIRVVRLLIHEGPVEDIQENLARSVPDGVRRYGRYQITAVTLGTVPFPILFESQKTEEENEQR